MNNKERVSFMREVSQCGLPECQRMLNACNNDPYLALGYLRFQGLAHNVKKYDPESGKYVDNKDEWVRRNAEAEAERLRSLYGQ